MPSKLMDHCRNYYSNMNVPKVIRILCTIVENKKYSNNNIDAKIFEIFKGMKGNDNFKGAIAEAKKDAKKSVALKIKKHLE